MRIVLEFDGDLMPLEAYSDVKPQFSVGDEFSMKVRIEGIRYVRPTISTDTPYWLVGLTPAGVLEPEPGNGTLFLHATLETSP